MKQFPTFGLAVALPPAWSTTVPAEFIDANDHMTVGQYAVVGGHSTAAMLESVGVTDAYREGRRMGFFVAEQHTHLISEIRRGHEISMHPRVLSRGDKTVHLVSYLLNRSTRQVASSLEEKLVHVDLDVRRSRPMPDDVTAGVDSLIAQSDRLPWTSTLSLCMDVQRK